MSNAAFIAERLVIREEVRTRSRMLAYERVAGQVGKSATWLRRFIRDGRAQVSGEIERKLDSLLIRGLENEIARLQAELEMARQSGCHPASQYVAEVEKHLSHARSLLNGGGA